MCAKARKLLKGKKGAKVAPDAKDCPACERAKKLIRAYGKGK